MVSSKCSRVEQKEELELLAYCSLSREAEEQRRNWGEKWEEEEWR